MRRCGRDLGVLGLVVGAALGSVAGADAAGAQTTGSASVRLVESTLQGVEGRPVRVDVERTDLPVSRVLVHYRTEDGPGSATAGRDYTHTAGTLVFEVGDRTASFSVTLRDDDVPEQTEYLLVHLQTSSGTATSARLTVVDDDRSSSVAAAPTPAVGAASSPPATAPPRSASAAPVTAPPPVVVASSASARRSAVARVRAPSRPAAPRRIILQQTPTTPFELRPAPGTAAATAIPTAVDPVLALAAGLLLARVAAAVWFRVRIGGA